MAVAATMLNGCPSERPLMISDDASTDFRVSRYWFFSWRRPSIPDPQLTPPASTAPLRYRPLCSICCRSFTPLSSAGDAYLPYLSVISLSPVPPNVSLAVWHSSSASKSLSLQI